TAQRDTHLLLVSLGLRLDSNRDYWLREVHTLKDDLLLDVAQGVTRGHILHVDQSSDVACAHFLDLFTLVGVHLHHTTNALLLTLDRVDHGVAGSENTGINTGKGQSTNEGVGSDLERQRRERSIVRSRTLIFRRIVALLQVIRMDTLNRRDVGRSRQEVDNSIENQRHTLVLEGGTQYGRNDFTGDGALTQTGLDLFQGEVALFQVLVHQLFIGLSRSFNQIRTILSSLILQLSRNLFLTEGHTLVVVVPVDSLHAQHVSLAHAVLCRADLQLQRNRRVAQALLDLRDNAQEVGALTVHLVHVDDTRNTVLVGLTPYGLDRKSVVEGKRGNVG